MRLCSRRLPLSFTIVWWSKFQVGVTRTLPVGASRLVGLDGLEPSTSRLSGARSSHLSYRPVFSGYSVRPSLKVLPLMVEMKGIEPLTPCLQGRCSPSWATPPFYWVCLSGLLIESWQLNNKIFPYRVLIHIYQVFCPNLTTKSQERLAFLASRSP